MDNDSGDDETDELREFGWEKWEKELCNFSFLRRFIMCAWELSEPSDIDFWSYDLKIAWARATINVFTEVELAFLFSS